MQSQELVAILRAKGIDATLEDLPACPGSYETPVRVVTMPNGDLLSIGRADDHWTRPDEDMGERLHMQTMPGYDDGGCFIPFDDDYDRRMRIWTPVNSREALAIAETFGRRLRYADGQVIEYTSFDPSGYSVGQVVRYAGEQDNPADQRVYIRARSGGDPFAVRESQLRIRDSHDGHVACAPEGCVLR
ncbi:MAG TPA: hypothetical protein VLM11_04795 [Streptosporangiaceae bacterium]|nr:hypothetical protein [Streptosporangiaceae bacterium]